MTRRLTPSMLCAIALAVLAFLVMVDPIARGLAACWTGESGFCGTYQEGEVK